MPSILDHFDALTARGLKLIPLRENSKIPMFKGWTKDWDRARARASLQRFPDANIGVLLGDVVDVEGDSEDANQLILDLIGDYPHPCYQSTKSIHHLFLTPDPALAHFRWNEVEFRGFGHQSVIPPSRHLGVAYRWMRTFRFPVPEMPPKLLEFYLSKQNGSAKHGEVARPGHLKCWCGTCGKTLYPHRSRFLLEIEAFKLLGQKWECQRCRTVDLRPICRKVKAGGKIGPDELAKPNHGK